MALKDTQELFWNLITAPEGTEKALRDSGTPLQVLEDVVKSDERMGAIERMDVYANMYFFRILEVLQDDFAKLNAWMGEGAFHNLVTDYLLVHQSTHPSLRYIGRHLPKFLQQRDQKAADLAALEWARVDVFDEVDHDVATVETLAALPPEQWAELAIEVTPALRVLELSSSAHILWRKVKEEAHEDYEPTDQTTRIRVWRRDGNVIVHKPMTELEHAALAGFGRGQTLGPLCESLVHLTEPESVAVEVAQFLQEWVSDQLIVNARILGDV